MKNMNKNKAGLVVGIFVAALHAVWAFLIAVIPGTLQSFLDWVFKLHSLEPYWKITTFDFVNAIILVVLGFIFGYIFGWIFAWIYNMMSKK